MCDLIRFFFGHLNLQTVWLSKGFQIEGGWELDIMLGIYEGHWERSEGSGKRWREKGFGGDWLVCEVEGWGFCLIYHPFNEIFTLNSSKFKFENFFRKMFLISECAGLGFRLNLDRCVLYLRNLFHFISNFFGEGLLIDSIFSYDADCAD